MFYSLEVNFKNDIHEIKNNTFSISIQLTLSGLCAELAQYIRHAV